MSYGRAQAGKRAWRTMRGLERTFDANIWKTGNAFVVTIPYQIVEKFKLKAGDELEVTVRK